MDRSRSEARSALGGPRGCNLSSPAPLDRSLSLTPSSGAPTSPNFGCALHPANHSALLLEAR